MFLSFVLKCCAVSFLMAAPSACSWLKNHPQEIEAIEKDLGDIAEEIIVGAPKSESRAPSPFAP